MSATNSPILMPITRLRTVTDALTRALIDTSRERAVCELDAEGRTARWRLWSRCADGGWAPTSEWRTPGVDAVKRASGTGPRGGAAS